MQRILQTISVSDFALIIMIKSAKVWTVQVKTVIITVFM